MKKKILNFFRFNYREYIKTNVMFITFVVGALLNSTFVRFITAGNFFSLRPIFADLIVLVVFGTVLYFIRPNRRIYYVLSISILLSFVCFINAVYYRFYESYTSISLLFATTQLIDVSDAVIWYLKWYDYIYIWHPITLYLLYRRLSKGDYFSRVLKIEKPKEILIKTTIVLLFVTSIFTVTLTTTEIGRLYTQWNRTFLVERFGLYAYHISDLIKSSTSRLSSVIGYDNALKEFNEFFKEKWSKEYKENEYTNILKGRNVIVIHAESTQTFSMFETLPNGREITPNLNRLAKEGMFFSNFYSQASTGTSSDTEFTFNTSVLPINNGTVFNSYHDSYYESLIKELKRKYNYYAVSMHGNNATYWNRNAMHPVLGFDRFFAKDDYIIDEEIIMGLSDKSFFKQSIEKLISVKENHDGPFWATLITLTNHTPFRDYNYEFDFDADFMEETKMGDYFKTLNYFDEALGEFIQGLDEAGLLENTVVILYGDHDAHLPKKDYIRFYNYDSETKKVKDIDDENYYAFDYYEERLIRKVPLIIWTKDEIIKPQEIKKPMGMIDCAPTLGNMLGARNKYELGNDIFSTENNIVVFPDGDWLDRKVYYYYKNETYKPLSGEELTLEYINKRNEEAEKIIKLSRNLIIYDLIRRSNE